MFDRDWLDHITPDLERIGATGTEQVALIGQCVELIDRQIPDRPPLWNACPHADTCWQTERAAKPKPMSARIPYVGPDYSDHRIAVVAINSRDSGHAGDEITATANVLDTLRAGQREYGSRSFFHYRVASAVHAVVNAHDGGPLEEKPEPQATARSLLTSARLQAVQCSPESTSRRTPTPAMVRNCPEFLLRGQLELLTPRILLLFGAAAHRAIETPPLKVDWSTTWQDSGGCFSRGQTRFMGQTMNILAFHHPSAAGWTRSWRTCLADLRSQPLTANREPTRRAKKPPAT